MNEYFEQIEKDLSLDPPDLQRVSRMVTELTDGLCKFVPSKKELHEQIRSEILGEDGVTTEKLYSIVTGLIKWIKKFQCPVDDPYVDEWLEDFLKVDPIAGYSAFIKRFLKEYYDHTEKVYMQTWEARRRLVNRESIIPPEHRPQPPEGKDGVPSQMKSGR